MRRILLIASLLVPLAACGRNGVAGDGTTGIEGKVVIGPTCPVESAASPCPPKPFEATITVLRGDGVVATRATGRDGSFRISLSPGTYRLRAESRGGGIARMLPIRPVTVRPVGYSSVTISFDSGIR